MIFQGDVYRTVINDAEVGEWTQVEGKTLAAVLSLPEVIHALALVLFESGEMLEELRRTDLSSPEGITKGVKLQGKMDGIEHCITQLLILAEEGNEDAGPRRT